MHLPPVNFIVLQIIRLLIKRLSWKKLKSRFCGYGYDDEEFAVGIGCLAVPIYDGQKKCVGTLGITGSIQEYRNKKKFEYMLSILHDSASKIAQNLIQ